MVVQGSYLSLNSVFLVCLSILWVLEAFLVEAFLADYRDPVVSDHIPPFPFLSRTQTLVLLFILNIRPYP